MKQKTVFTSEEEFNREGMTLAEAAESCNSEAKTFVLMAATPKPEEEGEFVEARIQGSTGEVCGLLMEAAERMGDKEMVKMGMYLIRKAGREAFASVMADQIVASSLEDTEEESSPEDTPDPNKELREAIMEEINDE